MSETNLETIYAAAREASKAKDYDRAIELLKQIVIIDENYKDASRLLARLIQEKRRRWYNDVRVWGAVSGVIAICLLVWIAPILSIQKMILSVTITVSPTDTLDPSKTAAPTIAPTVTPTIIPTVNPSPTPIPLVWKRISIGLDLPNDIISQIVLDPSDSDVIYVGTANAGIYKSIDGGISWRPINKGLRHAIIQSLVIDPIDTKILYTAASPQSAIYKTIDGGENWKTSDSGVHTDSGDAGLLVVDATNNKHLYFFAEQEFYTSLDQGVNWTLVKSKDVCPRGEKPNKSLVVDPGNSTLLYATISSSSQGCRAGVYKSEDGGKTWALTGLQVEKINMIFLEKNSRGEVFLYVSTEGGNDMTNPQYTSSDGGNTWQNTSRARSCEYMTVDPQGGVVASCDGVHKKTIDGGKTWEILDSYKSLWTMNISGRNTLAILSNDPTTIFLGAKGLYVSKNGGSSWQKQSSGLPIGPFEIIGDLLDSSVLYAFPWKALNQIFFDSPLYISNDNGRTWKNLGNLNDLTDFALDAGGNLHYRVSSINGNNLFLFRDGVLVDKRQLPGKSWEIETNPYLPGMIYTIADKKFYFSEDEGATWNIGRDFSPTTFGTFAFSKEPQIFYVVGHDAPEEIQYSDNNGLIWHTCLSRPLGDTQNLSESNFIVDPRDSQHLYIAGLSRGIYESRDGCQTWNSVKGEISDLSVNTLAFVPDNPDTLFAGTDDGAYISTDGGQIWGQINDGLLGVKVIYSLMVDRDNTVYAATPYGIFKLERK